MLRKLWNDEAGFTISTELALIATTGVIGLTVGVTALRDAILLELADVADAVSGLDQTYQIGGVQGANASSSGSAFQDTPGQVDGPSCIQFASAGNTSGDD